MITPHDENFFLYYSKVCQKIFCLKLPNVLVHLGNISTRRKRNLTGNLYRPTLILNFFHEHWWITRQQGKDVISLTLLSHFHPLHRNLELSWEITGESLPLHILSGQTQTKNLWCLSTSSQPISCRTLKRHRFCRYHGSLGMDQQ